MNTQQLRNAVLVLFFALAMAATACGASDPDGAGPPDDDQSGSDDGGLPADDGNPLGGGSYAIATLTVVVEHPDRETISYELACFGDTATLTPDAITGVSGPPACTALARFEVENYLVDGPPSDQVCTEIYGGPDTAHLVGRVNDRPVDIVVDRTNGCGINSWDVLLAEILPPAAGVL
ncbi:MAG: hypothetical protein HKN03_12695 [Acidimicrobiales bacterium]|nr:hypothetical protein [Acidimicrobiales bacterium]